MGGRFTNRPVVLASVFSTSILTETILGLLPVGTDVVVDVGGGECPYAIKAAARVHVAVDRRSPEASLASHQLVGDATSLPVAGGVAALVLCTEVVEHVADDDALYRELRRVVRDDGMVLLSAPFVHALHESPHDYRRPTSAGLLYGLENAGLEVRSMHAVGGVSVVVMDIGIRSISRRVRGVSRRLPAAGSRVIEDLFGRLQCLLADAMCRGKAATDEIDPLLPVPTLCLGYVVVANPA